MHNPQDDIVTILETINDHQTFVETLLGKLSAADTVAINEFGITEVVDALLNLAVFAPEPATFNQEEFVMTVDPDQSTDRHRCATFAFGLAKRLGMIQIRANRYSIRADLQTILLRYFID